MASSCKPQYFLNPRLYLLLLLLALTMPTLFSVSDRVNRERDAVVDTLKKGQTKRKRDQSKSAAESQLRGEVGGNVTFRCPVKQKNITFFYLQKKNIFVNGFHTTKKISDTWQNTKLYLNKTMVNMSSLNVSHSGDYRCLIYYTGDKELTETIIHLSVTAHYSKPEVTVHCSDENRGSGCLVTCSSHGGYPSAKMTWTVTGNLTWQVVNSSEMQDPHTKMVNSSSTASFNCSSGELKSLNCSMGNFTSNNISVCITTDVPDSLFVIAVAAAATCLVVTSIIIVVMVLRCKFKKGAAADLSLSRERMALNANGGEGAP